MVMLDVRGRPGKDSKELQADNRTGEARLRETVETGERLDTVSEPPPKKATHWFYSVPFAGVRYYAFDERTPDSESTDGDRVGGDREVGVGGMQTRAPTDTLAVPEQI